METTIIVFLWIVGALCLFIIAFLTYDIIVHAQDRKAKKQETAESTAPTEPAPASSGEGNSPAPAKTPESGRKPNANRRPKK